MMRTIPSWMTLILWEFELVSIVIPKLNLNWSSRFRVLITFSWELLALSSVLQLFLIILHFKAVTFIFKRWPSQFLFPFVPFIAEAVQYLSGCLKFNHFWFTTPIYTALYLQFRLAVDQPRYSADPKLTQVHSVPP